MIDRHSFNFDPASERIRLARRRLADAYARRRGAETPVVELAISQPLTLPTPLEALSDLETLAYQAVSQANGLASVDNDWPPLLMTLCTVPMVPQAFGCTIEYNEHGHPWAKPAVSDIAQVWSLTPRAIDDTPLIRRLFAWVDYAQRTLGTEVPYWTVDIQSPFSVAAQVMGTQELLCACLTDPGAVHHLCRMITDFSIDFMQRHIAQMEHPAFPGLNFPSIDEPIGVCLADDTPLIMLSPAMYREFAMPYNNLIGVAFGGLHIHSCGDYRHNLDNLLDLTNIRSIQAHAGPGEFPLPERADEEYAFNRARRSITCFIDVNDVTRGDVYRDQPMRHYGEYVLPRLCAGDLTGVILQSCGVGEGIPDVASALRWTREQLASSRHV
jgi:hypothetical protein